MNLNLRNSIASIHGFRTSTSFGKYLGVDIRPNKLKISNFMGLLDKTLERIRGWQSKLLNMASRCTLFKYVLNTYLLYSMQTSLLLSTVIIALKMVIGNFSGLKLIEVGTLHIFLGIMLLNLWVRGVWELEASNSGIGLRG